ncbi:MAG: hypothetical protein MUF07_04665 [Steroidobacteraceae bacterium]|jgi:hypothetical protein|nr:hypothetical protein [Steroidobacteraceae bacterium]
MITNDSATRSSLARSATLALVSAALVACASPPRVSSTRFTAAFPPRSADAPVRLYQTSRPDCAYEEIGSVKVKGRDFERADLLADAMRARVRELGGDAIVNFTKGEVVVGSRGTAMGGPMIGDPWMGGPWIGGFPPAVMTDVRNDTKLVMTGTVIRFTGDCPASR